MLAGVVVAATSVLPFWIAVRAPLPDSEKPAESTVSAVPEQAMPTPTPLPPDGDKEGPGPTPPPTPGGPAGPVVEVGGGGGTVGGNTPSAPCASGPGYAVRVEPAENPTAVALAKAIAASTTWLTSDVVAVSELNEIFDGSGSILANRSLPETLILVRLTVEGGPIKVDGQTLSELVGVMDVAIVSGPCSRPSVRLVKGLKEKTLNDGMDYAVRALSDAFKDELVKLIKGEE